MGAPLRFQSWYLVSIIYDITTFEIMVHFAFFQMPKHLWFNKGQRFLAVCLSFRSYSMQSHTYVKSKWVITGTILL